MQRQERLRLVALLGARCGDFLDCRAPGAGEPASVYRLEIGFDHSTLRLQKRRQRHRLAWRSPNLVDPEPGPIGGIYEMLPST